MDTNDATRIVNTRHEKAYARATQLVNEYAKNRQFGRVTIEIDIEAGHVNVCRVTKTESIK